MLNTISLAETIACKKQMNCYVLLHVMDCMLLAAHKFHYAGINTSPQSYGFIANSHKSRP